MQRVNQLVLGVGVLLALRKGGECTGSVFVRVRRHHGGDDDDDHDDHDDQDDHDDHDHHDHNHDRERDRDRD